ncbi:hypothetical protein SERLADRAFT_400120 [Serpula lacrymans var. lacrymans S7.9]|uniref:Uncharacterized protein n=1 Tax=Serpula lacrymans var. lacrymans (strain S7.9) TaxID=578457 RepID=F8P8W9_SERL9|nr:uncharacterized protein SERLADRAFT_400120 [Serpula lacrymans var. lacrymans S7.9]EGO20098.1 hypothetical protein SERLADRAFT_400120 [Serpula lacrymans var. lacrymans S7.9]
MRSFRARRDGIGAWFLGPKAENATVMRRSIMNMVETIMQTRLGYSSEDEPTIT